jgi:hypothetical protein
VANANALLSPFECEYERSIKKSMIVSVANKHQGKDTEKMLICTSHIGIYDETSIKNKFSHSKNTRQFE